MRPFSKAVVGTNTGLSALLKKREETGFSRPSLSSRLSASGSAGSCGRCKAAGTCTKHPGCTDEGGTTSVRVAAASQETGAGSGAGRGGAAQTCQQGTPRAPPRQRPTAQSQEMGAAPGAEVGCRGAGPGGPSQGRPSPPRSRNPSPPAAGGPDPVQPGAPREGTRDDLVSFLRWFPLAARSRASVPHQCSRRQMRGCTGGREEGTPGPHGHGRRGLRAPLGVRGHKPQRPDPASRPGRSSLPGPARPAGPSQRDLIPRLGSGVSPPPGPRHLQARAARTASGCL